MGLRDTLTGAVSGLLLEQPLKNKDMAEIAQELDLAGGRLKHTFAGAKDNPDNRRLLSHIVGMERWGQSRLRVLLGAPLLHDEYDSYQPAADLPLDEQIATFHATRQETVALTRTLEERKLPDSDKVEHNDFGPMSARGWLSYLSTHASIESKRIK